MTKKAFLILVMLLMALIMALNCSAFTLSHYSRNAYSFEPLINVHVTLLNNDTNGTMEGFSDSNGLTSFTVLEGNYTITAYLPTYNLHTIWVENLSDDETRISYMTYESSSYLKFNFADMTFYKHEWCYYTEQNRLFGCYYENDTIYLSPNHNYTARPKLNMLEQAGFMDIRSFLIQISIFLVIIATLLITGIFLIGFTLIIVRKFIRK
jgi:hypothetical protein